jgi:hypothetical protein
MERPTLNPIPLSEAWPRPGTVTVTLSRGQWDTFLGVAYEQGAVLLELDEHERPVAAYRRRPLPPPA